MQTKVMHIYWHSMVIFNTSSITMAKNMCMQKENLIRSRGVNLRMSNHSFSMEMLLFLSKDEN